MLLAWLGALCIGLTLGLLGSGGSILTVPVLVYLVGQPEKVAIAESLGIVALIALVGALPFAFKRLVHWRSVFFFGGPGIVGTYLGAYLSQYMSGALQLVIFAGVMLVAAYMMLKSPHRNAASEGPREPAPHAAWKVILEGLAVGVVTGLVGVGGGFLIVPALVLLVGLSMHMAVGTSLMIIAAKSLSGFYKYIDVLGEAGLSVDWNLVLIFAGIGIAGSFIGGKVGQYIEQQRLKKGFAFFILVMGVGILWQNAGMLVGA